MASTILSPPITSGSMIRQVDSSLLDEWEKMRDPNFQRAETKEVRPPGAEAAALDVTRDTKAFTAAIRNRIFVFLRGLVIADYEAALESLGSPLTPALSPSEGERENRRPSGGESGDAGTLGGRTLQFPLPRGGGEGQGEGERGEKTEHRTSNIEHPTSNAPLTPALSPSEGERESDGEPWSAGRLQQAMDAYHAGHEQLLLTPEARNLRHTYVTPAEDKKSWRVQQMLVDPEDHNDWVAEFEVDLAQSRTLGEPVLRLRRFGSLV